MAAAGVEQVYRYEFASHIDDRIVRLASVTDTGRDPASPPFFFRSPLANPRRTADQLRALIDVVRARHHIPAAMLDKILREADPVVTANDDVLRFEGFSGCCGAYARVDLLPAALGAGAAGRGTTNVDFNAPMLAALARIKAGDDVSITVGSDSVALTSGRSEVIEKKVTLPLRWLRGLVEVQAVQSRMREAFAVDAVHAQRFLRSLPRMKTNRRTTWIHASGAGLRLSQVQRPNAIAVGGLERLRTLDSLVADAERLVVYSDERTGASAWVLHFADSRFTLAISPEVWRGFSGEGQALRSLAGSDGSAPAAVRAQLAWQTTIDAAAIGGATCMTRSEVDAALAALGTQGLVGFDVSSQRYFHRELPFDLSVIEALQPRLIAARKLVDGDAVRLVETSVHEVQGFVRSGDVDHRVVASGEPPEWTCTCPWFAKHADTRGPCKHVLAAQLVTQA